jgi:hypothetical protein
MTSKPAVARSDSVPTSAGHGGEAVVALTDALLAIESAAFAIELARDPRTRGSALGPPFLAFFGATAVASLSGSALHARTTDRSDPLRRILWRLSLSSIGVAALSSWVLAVRLAASPGRRRDLERAAAVAHVPYFVVVTCTDAPYRIAVIWYVPAALALGGALASRLGSGHDRRPAATALAGLAVTFAAAGVQTRGVGFGPRFDHNALYHTLQGVAVWLFRDAGQGFLRRPPGGSDAIRDDRLRRRRRRVERDDVRGLADGDGEASG